MGDVLNLTSPSFPNGVRGELREFRDLARALNDPAGDQPSDCPCEIVEFQPCVAAARDLPHSSYDAWGVAFWFLALMSVVLMAVFVFWVAANTTHEIVFLIGPHLPHFSVQVRP